MTKNKQQAESRKPMPSLKFIEAARAFETAEIDRVRKTAKTAWRITAACLLITGLAVGAVAGLTPLKTVVPFLWLPFLRARSIAACRASCDLIVYLFIFIFYYA